MAKTYIDTVKYVVHASVEIDGIVEKPDVVGALFGQTEGLLGEELDLRELQKSGRIGRIDVNLEIKSGKTVGEIILPSSLDKVETSILAAALESVDRVGPCIAKIKINKIDDTRTDKRELVVGRAKQIVKEMMGELLPERKEISELVRDEVKTAEVMEYGPDKLAAGPNIDDASDIIVVEGRADVITMLKCDIRNVISLQGKIIPQTIVELAKEKNITAFVDGDRGGDLIIKQLADVAEIEYVAKAPDGKEVEELMKKEVVKCLRNRMTYQQYMEKTAHSERPVRRPYREYRFRTPLVRERRFQPAEKFSFSETPRPPLSDLERFGPSYHMYFAKLRELEGTLRGVLLDKDDKVIAETDVKDISEEMERKKDVESVVFDGIITQRLVDIAARNHIKNLIGVRKSRIENVDGVNIITP